MLQCNILPTGSIPKWPKLFWIPCTWLVNNLIQNFYIFFLFLKWIPYTWLVNNLIQNTKFKKHFLKGIPSTWLVNNLIQNNSRVLPWVCGQPLSPLQHLLDFLLQCFRSAAKTKWRKKRFFLTMVWRSMPGAALVSNILEI